MRLAGDVLQVQLALRLGSPSRRQLRLRADLLDRLQVGEILLQHPGRGGGVERGAMAGHDVLGLGEERTQPLKRGSIRGGTCRRLRQRRGSPHRRGSRRATSTRAQGIQMAMPSAVWPFGRVQLELVLADRAGARGRAGPAASRAQAGSDARGSTARRRRATRAGARRARRAGAAAVLSAQPSAACREREATEQMVPVSVRRQQTAETPDRTAPAAAAVPAAPRAGSASRSRSTPRRRARSCSWSARPGS